MNIDHVRRIKAIDRPRMKQADVGTKSPFIHTDSGIEFKTRSQLKKAIRLAWSKPNPIRSANRERFTLAIRRIVRENDLDIQKVTATEIKKMVEAKSGNFSKSQIETLFQQEITKLVTSALGGQANIRAKVKELVVEETKRLVMENISIEANITGRVFRPSRNQRALQLDQD